MVELKLRGRLSYISEWGRLKFVPEGDCLDKLERACIYDHKPYSRDEFTVNAGKAISPDIATSVGLDCTIRVKVRHYCFSPKNSTTALRGSSLILIDFRVGI